jgi:ethanolaminephosphotransferase
MPYLTREGAAALRRYTYAGADYSLLYKHVLSPLADFCVRTFVPLWMA